MPEYKSKLHQMTVEFPTDYWNDSCSEAELTYAVSNGAVGATSNPTIVYNVLKQELHLWEKRIHTLIDENPTWSEIGNYLEIVRRNSCPWCKFPATRL